MPHSSAEPFVGPRPFQRDDAKFFFGRDREAEDVVSLIMAHRALLIFSPSGAGKSSLLHACVVPRLSAPERGACVLGIVRVSGQLLASEATHSLANVFVYHLLVSLGADEAQARHGDLVGCLERLAEPHALESDAPIVLVIDQFEEVFTRHTDRWRDREPFFKALGAASQRIANLRLVFAMREEYLAQLAPFVRFLPERVRAQYHLDRLKRASALEAIQGPVERAGRSFAPGAAESLVTSLLRVPVSGDEQREIEVEFVEPVHLQVACRNLWKSLRDDQTVIDDSSIQKAGSIETALQSYYDTCVAESARAGSVGEARLRKWIEDVLITAEGTRSIVPKGAEQTSGMNTNVVELLESRHIVRAEMRGGSVFYELTHDRFLQPIRRSNRAWRERELGRNADLNELEARATAWAADGRKVQKPTPWRVLTRRREWLRELALLRAAERMLQHGASAGLEPSALAREYTEAHSAAYSHVQRGLIVAYGVGVTTIVVALGGYAAFLDRKRDIAAAENDKLALQITESQQQKAEADTRVANSVREVAEHQKRASKLIEEFTLKEDERQQLEGELATLRSELEDERARDAKQRELELATYEAEKGKAQDALAIIEAEVRAAREASRQQEAALRDATAAAEQMRRAREVLEGELSGLNARLESLKRDRDAELAELKEQRELAARKALSVAESSGRGLEALALALDVAADELRTPTQSQLPLEALQRALASVWRRQPLASPSALIEEAVMDASGTAVLSWGPSVLSVVDARSGVVLFREPAGPNASWIRAALTRNGDRVLAVRREARAGGDVSWSLVERSASSEPGGSSHVLDLARGEGSVLELDADLGHVVVASDAGTHAFGIGRKPVTLLPAQAERADAAPNGAAFAVVAGDNVHVLKAGSGEQRTKFRRRAKPGNEVVARPLAFSSDGKRLAVLAYLQPWFGSDGYVVCVRASSDGDVLSEYELDSGSFKPQWVGFTADDSAVVVFGSRRQAGRTSVRAVSFDAKSGKKLSDRSIDGNAHGLPGRDMTCAVTVAGDGLAEVVVWNVVSGERAPAAVEIESSRDRVLLSADRSIALVTPSGTTPVLVHLGDPSTAAAELDPLLIVGRRLLENRPEYEIVLESTKNKLTPESAERH